MHSFRGVQYVCRGSLEGNVQCTAPGQISAACYRIARSTAYTFSTGDHSLACSAKCGKIFRLRMVRALIWHFQQWVEPRGKVKCVLSFRNQVSRSGEICGLMGILSPRAWVQPPVGVLHACVQILQGLFPLSRQDFARNHLRQTSISIVFQMLFECVAMCKNALGEQRSHSILRCHECKICMFCGSRPH